MKTTIRLKKLTCPRLLLRDHGTLLGLNSDHSTTDPLKKIINSVFLFLTNLTLLYIDGPSKWLSKKPLPTNQEIISDSSSSDEDEDENEEEKNSTLFRRAFGGGKKKVGYWIFLCTVVFCYYC